MEERAKTPTVKPLSSTDANAPKLPLAGALNSVQPRASRVVPNNTVAAFSLTSKQRSVHDDTLRSVVQLLLLAAPQLEGSALNEVMLDPVASEYITANGARVEDISAVNAGASTFSASFSPADPDRSAVSLLSGSGSALDSITGTWVSTSARDTPPHTGSQRSRRFSRIMSASSSVMPSATTASPMGSRLGHVHAPSIHPSNVPHGRRSSISGVALGEALSAVNSLVRSGEHTYCYPEEWFYDGRVHPHDVRAHTANPVLCHDEVLANRGTPSAAPRPRSVTSTPLSRALSFYRFTLEDSVSHSSAQTTYPSSSPPALPLSDAGTVSASAGALAVPSGWEPPGFSAARPVRKPEVSAAVTAQPPLYFDNLLLDPASSRYLFGGHAFLEEARVLQVSIPVNPADAAHSALPSSGTSRERAHSSRARGGKKLNGSRASFLLLLREYIPLSAECKAGYKYRRLKGATGPPVVQCFSLLPPHFTRVRSSRYHLLTETTVIASLLVALPGCVTITTPLDTFMREERHSHLLAAGLSPERLQRAPSEAKRSTRDVNDRVSLTHIFAHRASTADPQMRMRQSFAGLDRPSDAAGHRRFSRMSSPTRDADEDDMRVTMLEERLERSVLPDVLEEAMQVMVHFLSLHTEQWEQRRLMSSSLRAVGILQRFFRRCLAVKKRAVRRMVRQWRRLEVEARLKLQQHRPLPTAVERMDTVANGILQEHMLTSLSYKRKFIEDQWAARRRAFTKWKEEEVWNNVFESTARAEGSGMDATVGGDATAAQDARSARLSAAQEMRLRKDFQQRKQQYTKRFLVGKRSVPTAVISDTHVKREQAALRRFLSWYIDPQELLYLSHQRLLETLKGTVFRLAEVQNELKLAAAEVADDDGSGPLMNSGSISAPNVALPKAGET